MPVIEICRNVLIIGTSLRLLCPTLLEIIKEHTKKGQQREYMPYLLNHV